eukprot:scaffold7819_cov178-Alexandrium_tamarense.AAC.6
MPVKCPPPPTNRHHQSDEHVRHKKSTAISCETHIQPGQSIDTGIKCLVEVGDERFGYFFGAHCVGEFGRRGERAWLGVCRRLSLMKYQPYGDQWHIKQTYITSHSPASKPSSPQSNNNEACTDSVG